MNRKNYNREYYIKHIEQAAKYGKVYREKNKEKVKDCLKKYYIENKEKVRNRIKEWELNNKEKVKKDHKIWAINNPERIKLMRDKNNIKRRSTCKGKLNDSMATGIYLSLKGNKSGRHWEDLVGYKLQDLKQHLESKFTSDMNWNNYGRTGWTIDHIIPIYYFNFNTSDNEDFKKCWDLTNLQPMWAKDNYSKGNKIQNII